MQSFLIFFFNMKTPNYNTLAFIRYYFHIPVSCKLSWGLIEETLDGKTEIRLGVALLNRPNFYIDVAMRRFFTQTVLFGGGLVRKVYPARRKADRDEFISITVRCILLTCGGRCIEAGACALSAIIRLFRPPGLWFSGRC